ncbi:MAG: DUF6691 family protein [Pseudomonadota bacterium]
MRGLVAFSVGALFGMGLLISGMTDTTKVQGWLDIFGNWDPTLAFVMGGAILPMALAWRVTNKRRPLLADTFPANPGTQLDKPLVTGSVLFGMGWGLAGLCPGPAIASLGFGGLGGVIFTLSMFGGMILAPALRQRLDQQTASV